MYYDTFALVHDHVVNDGVTRHRPFGIIGGYYIMYMCPYICVKDLLMHWRTVARHFEGYKCHSIKKIKRKTAHYWTHDVLLFERWRHVRDVSPEMDSVSFSTQCSLQVKWMFSTVIAPSVSQLRQHNQPLDSTAMLKPHKWSLSWRHPWPTSTLLLEGSKEKTFV